MSNLKQYFYYAIHTMVLLVTPITGYGNELSFEENKVTEMNLSADFAANYLDEMNQIQAELVTKHQKFSDLIMASAGGSLNKRLPSWLESEANLHNQKLDSSSLYIAMSISTMKLGILAQELGLKDAASCHFKESKNLESAANGTEPIIANCRPAAYKGVESKAIRLSTTKESEVVSILVNKWVNLNILYSKSMACIKNQCI